MSGATGASDLKGTQHVRIDDIAALYEQPSCHPVIVILHDSHDGTSDSVSDVVFQCNIDEDTGCARAALGLSQDVGQGTLATPLAAIIQKGHTYFVGHTDDLGDLIRGGHGALEANTPLPPTHLQDEATEYAGWWGRRWRLGYEFGSMSPDLRYAAQAESRSPYHPPLIEADGVLHALTLDKELFEGFALHPVYNILSVDADLRAGLFTATNTTAATSAAGDRPKSSLDYIANVNAAISLFELGRVIRMFDIDLLVGAAALSLPRYKVVGEDGHKRLTRTGTSHHIVPSMGGRVTFYGEFYPQIFRTWSSGDAYVTALRHMGASINMMSYDVGGDQGAYAVTGSLFWEI